MTQYGMSRFQVLPPVIKNLIIINVLVYLAELVWPGWMIDNLSLYYFDSPYFKPVQLVTHMFMHQPYSNGDTGSISFAHIFFNMFALWMFGSVLENVWGPKRFLTFYFVTAFGAVFLHQAVEAYQLYQATGSIFLPASPDNFSPGQLETTYSIANSPVLGASGAIFGVLAAFGMLFPNTMLYIYFLFPIKAKYFILFYIGIELFLGFQNSSGDNVAHFAHLGGALFGFILVKYWQRNNRRFY